MISVTRQETLSADDSVNAAELRVAVKKLTDTKVNKDSLRCDQECRHASANQRV